MSDRSRFLEGLEPLDVEETWPMLLGGRYRIVRPMGQGGYGRVFEAVDLLTEQTVAIKQLRPHGLSPATDRVRFLNEARTLEALENTVIVTLHDTANPDDEVPFFVMEFIEGETLAAYLRRRRYLSVREVFLIAARLLEGLAAVHEVGVVHRDIKPGNVVLKISDLGEISLKLLDFGLSGR
ncbi:MAG: serine/threonine-protein kinase, partial [Myxococcota bacterium]